MARKRTPKPPPQEIPNRLYYGDCLTIMESYLKQGEVDLIYLDPPFNSKKTYNLMYRTMTGKPVPEQAEAFCDTWEMDEEKYKIAKAMPEIMRQYQVDDYYAKFWSLWVYALKDTQPHLLAYIIYMVRRLLVMRAILKPTGSIFLHCDPTASHYMKVMMDGIFGHKNFRNEIIWKRSSAHSDTKQGRQQFGRIHDVLLFYSRSDRWTWNPQYSPYGEEYLDSTYRHKDPDGRRWKSSDLTGPGGDAKGNPQYEFMGVKRYWRFSKENMERLLGEGRIYQSRPGAVPRMKHYLDEMHGVPLQDVWTDLRPIGAHAAERLGYPTQKPIALLERIIRTSSNEDDVVFDPFCGCGTTIYAAEKTNRRWIGCDIEILSVGLVADTLTARHKLTENLHFEVKGIPMSVDAARHLFERDKAQFQHWLVEKVGGFPTQKKSADRGIDGRIYFEIHGQMREMVLSVKGGQVHPSDVRDLRGVLEREDNAEVAGFLSLEDPTKGMRQEAATAGMFEHNGISYPRIQFLTVREILEEKREFRTPSKVGSRVKTEQRSLPLLVKMPATNHYREPCLSLATGSQWSCLGSREQSRELDGPVGCFRNRRGLCFPCLY